MRALYVEDNPLDADLTKKALLRATPPIAIDIASSVAEALTKLSTKSADYAWVLFDLNLPDADGLDVLRYVREQRMPIAAIAVTGSGDEQSVIRALKLGVDDYIIKQGDYLAELPATLVAVQRRTGFAYYNHPLHILYVEDNVHDALLATRHLATKAPHLTLDVVHDDRGAIARLQSGKKYDVLLFDYSLGGVDAVELTRCIRNQLHLDLPVVIVTGRGSEATAASALRLGVLDYIIKDESYLQRLPAVLEFASARAQLAQESTRLEFLAMYEDFLRESKEAAESISVAKSTFLANLSHEIRTPMNAILGLGFLLEKTELTPQQRDYVEKVERSAQYLMSLLNDVLDYSKADAGKVELEAIDFCLGDLLSDVCMVLSGAVEAKGLSLTVIVADGVPQELHGDPLRLKQILINLGNNAIKFTDHGTVAIGVRLSALSSQWGALEFSIRDTGIGMESEQLETVFEAFHQGDQSISRRFGGSGLGLAICKQLVALMGGALRATSTPGVGSNFQFDISLKRPTGVVPTPVNISEQTAASANSLHGRVLLVEDNLINQQVGQAMLSHLGLQVEVVGDGTAAMNSLQLHDLSYYDAVLMDLQMPGLDGIATTKLIRQLEGFADIPIIAMTSDVLPRDRLRCLVAGMDDHLGKPIDMLQLKRVLANWLAKRGELGIVQAFGHSGDDID